MKSITITTIHVMQALLAIVGMWQLISGGVLVGFIIILLTIASESLIPPEIVENDNLVD